MVPTLVVNPAHDQVFAAFAQLMVDHGTSSITDFQRRLRTVYPTATVHARELAGESLLVWYVYRDGHWVRPERPEVPERPDLTGPTRLDAPHRRAAGDAGPDNRPGRSGR